jgi:hypothetical protein
MSLSSATDKNGVVLVDLSNAKERDFFGISIPKKKKKKKGYCIVLLKYLVNSSELML